NSLRDTDAARSVFSSGLKIYSVTLPEKQLLHFNTALYDRVKKLGTRASDIIEKVHESDTITKLLNEDHFYVWDEMTAIFFNDSSLFSFSPSKGDERVMVLTGVDRKGMEKAYLLALGLPGDYHLSPRTSVIFTEIPRNPSLFRADVRPIVNRVIDVYGIEEWKACLLTNEFHRHLGIYSLVGAKMGVRAREILEAPFDTLEVISNAGNNPPTSCMNDGLQVSTGASLGRGTIRVLEDKPSPSAVFVYNDLSLTLTLKKEVWEKVKKHIRKLIEKHGGMNKAYFKDVRELSIQYWLDLSRYEIFDEQMKKSLPGGR
ncbi:MAG: formylmethanofuran dehydrogenase subunit E family protein, partial [Desulfobacteraceae bacterium]